VLRKANGAERRFLTACSSFTEQLWFLSTIRVAAGEHTHYNDEVLGIKWLGEMVGKPSHRMIGISSSL
jgi:hypothetical protein